MKTEGSRRKVFLRQEPSALAAGARSRGRPPKRQRAPPLEPEGARFPTSVLPPQKNKGRFDKARTGPLRRPKGKSIAQDRGAQGNRRENPRAHRGRTRRPPSPKPKPRTEDPNPEPKTEKPNLGACLVARGAPSKFKGRALKKSKRVNLRAET